MIDTGATVTTIDTETARTLALKPSGQIKSFGIGGESVGFTVGCSVNIHGLNIDIPRAHCHDLTKYSRGLIALIGRDVLLHMILHYDGPKGQLYLEIPIAPSNVAHTRTKKPRPKSSKKRRRR